MSRRIYIEDIKRLDIRPGDTLLLRVSAAFSAEAVKKVHETIEEFFPRQNIKILTVVGDIEIEVLNERES